MTFWIQMGILNLCDTAMSKREPRTQTSKVNKELKDSEKDMKPSPRDDLKLCQEKLNEETSCPRSTTEVLGP